MIYILAALLPPIGLLLNGQPFSALFNFVLLVICVFLGLIFQPLWLLPSAHAMDRARGRAGSRVWIVPLTRSRSVMRAEAEGAAAAAPGGPPGAPRWRP